MWPSFDDAIDTVGEWYHITGRKVFGMRCCDFLSAHKYLEFTLVVVLLPPYLATFYTMAAMSWLYDQSYETVYEIEEPRRELLTRGEIAKRVAKREERDAVKTLPVARPRALTLRSNHGNLGFENHQEDTTRKTKGLRQSTIDQLGYCDLWRLPFEVRELIWKYTVGGNHIHIVKVKGRLGSVYCPAEDPTDPLRRDLCTKMGKQGLYEKSAWPRDLRPLALLVSCRQV